MNKYKIVTAATFDSLVVQLNNRATEGWVVKFQFTPSRDWAVLMELEDNMSAPVNP